MSRTPIVLAALLLSTACPSEEADTTPTTPELDAGWTEVEGGPGTSCSRGSRFAFYVHPGTVNKVVIDFIGGGACWDQTTCSVADAIFTDSIDSIANAVSSGDTFSGIYDKEHESNPVKDWYHVVIPYCTGDLHWGNNIETYGEGDNSFAINHVGAVNSRFVLDWVYENFSAPEDIVVTGCSAGAYGAALWSSYVADHYPDSRVVQFGDSGAGIITEEFFLDSFPSWNAQEAFPFFIAGLDPAQINIYEKNLADLYVEIAGALPEMHLSQFNTTYDRTQFRYFEAMGGGSVEEWSEQMIAMVGDISGRAENFCNFRGPGAQHCILGYENFYTYEADGELFLDWVTSLVEGDEPADVTCTDCGEPAR